MRRYSLGLISMLGLSANGFAQQVPIPMPASTEQFIQVPAATPQDKKDDKKDDKKQPDPPVPPPVTFPATNRPNLPASALAAAGTSIRRSSQPNVYGDLLTGTTFSPVLIATLPTGERVAVQPGQTSLFPLGTTFDRTVQTQIVSTNVAVPTPGNPQGTTHQIIRVDQIQVTGPDAVAHDGGLPINVVRGSFKISENESPRPQDRIYATYNFFSNVNPSLSVPSLATINVHRTTLGLEKTFLDGDASIGVRLPLLQVGGPANIERQSLGDLSVILKYAPINETLERADGSVIPGNCVSFGLVVTSPTGNASSYSALEPGIHPVMLQPYVGAILVRDDWYVQGFSSVAVPLDARDTTYLFNSIHLGYRLFESTQDDRWIQSITPVLEFHVNTPLANRGITRLPIGSFDIVSITGGTTFGLGQSSVLNLGVNVPVTGPKPYTLEAIAQLNIRY